MLKPLLLMVLLCLLSACAPNKVEELEAEYAKALASGQFELQITTISELSALDSQKYQHHIRLYQQLKPSLASLSSGKPVAQLALDSETLQQLLDFISTNSPIRKEVELALSQTLNNEKRVKLIEDIRTQKAKLLTAIKPTPAHIETTQTDLILSKSEIELVSPHFAQLLSYTLPLDSYQFELLVVELSQLQSLYDELLSSLHEESALFETELDRDKISREINEGYRLLVAIYRQQQSKSFDYAIAQNNFLNSIITSQKNHTAIDVIWQRSFKPAAQESVVTLKQNYLSKLTFIKHNTGKISAHDEVFASLIANDQVFSQALTKLLWPTEGLFHFNEYSDEYLEQAASLISSGGS